MNWPKKTLIRIYIELCMNYGKTYVHPINLGVIYIFICPPCCLYKILKNKKDSVDGTQLAATLLLWFHQTDNRIYRSIQQVTHIKPYSLMAKLATGGMEKSHILVNIVFNNRLTIQEHLAALFW